MMRALKLAGKIVAGVIVIALFGVFLLLAAPSWFFNTRTVSAAVKRFGSGYRPEWKQLDLSIGSPGLLTKRVVFDASDLCLDERHGALKACFPRLRLDATVRLGFSPPVSVNRLETLLVRAGPVRLDETAAPKTKKKRKKAASVDVALLPRALRRMTVGTVDVDVPTAEIIAASGTSKISLKSRFSDQSDKPLTAELFAVLTGTSAASVSRYRADVSLDSDLFRSGSISRLNATARVRGTGVEAELRALARDAGNGSLSLTASATARSSGRLLKARLDGLYSVSRATATASISVENPTGPLRRAELRSCRFDAPLGKRGPKSADLKCAIALIPGKFGGRRAVLKELPGSLSVHADFKRLRTQRDHFTADVRAELGPAPEWYGFFARLGVKLAGRTGSLPASLTARHELDTGFEVADFQELVKSFSGTEFAVPAPLNALKGRAAFSARTAGDSRGEDQALDFRASTALSSARQRMNVQAHGRLSAEDLFLPSRRLRDETEVELSDVVLELPYLKLGAAPSPMVDARIKTGDPKRDAAVEARRNVAQNKASTSTVVAYDVRIFTRKPVRLLTNLIKEPVPVALDLRARPAGLEGRIQLQPFELQAFRQKARVDHVTLFPRPGGADMGLDGKLVYKRQDTEVDILLLGSTEKPQVTFQSRPPLSQNEIVALLLYGKSPNELDSDQQASAGTASSAFTDGAFGLASLYLFAATPVDSVSYDPASQSYEVKFKLPGGATLGVGSDLEESRTLTLRKRLLRNVELETQLKQNERQTGRDAVTTFIQWFRRY